MAHYRIGYTDLFMHRSHPYTTSEVFPYTTEGLQRAQTVAGGLQKAHDDYHGKGRIEYYIYVGTPD